MTDQWLIRRRTRAVRRLVRKLVGTRMIDGGQHGTLVRCHECGGDGLLHKLDQSELDRMKHQALANSPMTDGYDSGADTAGQFDGEIR